MTTHSMTSTTTIATPTTPTPPPTPGVLPKDVSGVSEVLVSDRSLSSLSPPSRSVSVGVRRIAEPPNVSHGDFLRDCSTRTPGLSHRSVNFEVPKVRLENSDFDSGAHPYGRFRILIRTSENSDFDSGAPPKGEIVTTRLTSAALAEIFPDGVLPWQTSAACDPGDTEIFYPEKWLQAAAAKAICHTCLVRSECLAAADDDFGIWGGLTPGERRSR